MGSKIKRIIKAALWASTTIIIISVLRLAYGLVTAPIKFIAIDMSFILAVAGVLAFTWLVAMVFICILLLPLKYVHDQLSSGWSLFIFSSVALVIAAGSAVMFVIPVEVITMPSPFSVEAIK